MKNTKKLIFIILVLFLITGCSIEYNLNFENESLTEDISVKLNGTDYTIDKIENLKVYNLLAISKGLEQIEYEKKFEDSSNEFIMNYHYKYVVDDFYKNNVLSQCYDSFALVSEEDYYLLTTGKEFRCLSIEYQTVSDYEINIKTNHKVLEHNADEVKDGVYTWRINNPNNLVSINKPIMIKFSSETDTLLIDNNWFILGIIVVAIVLVGGIIFLVAYYKNKD